MDLDRIIHDKKNFAEFDDADIEAFLRGRKFKTEHLNLEFKREFPRRSNGKFDIKKICKYIVGFSNEEGGLIMYGVADAIKDPAATFADYVPGFTQQPSFEDLSEWVKERVHPSAASPAIRIFQVAGKNIAILKIPSGVNKPYCYYDPQERSITYFNKTAGGITELPPDAVREFYRSQMIEQATRLLRAAESQSRLPVGAIRSNRFKKHRDFILPKLEDIENFGWVGIYSYPTEPVALSVDELRQFLELHRFQFAEEMRYAPGIEVFQNGVTLGYFPTGIRKDLKSSYRVTVYNDGVVVLDSQAAPLMDKDTALHAGWLGYELQRHLQLAKAVLKGAQVSAIRVMMDFEHIEDLSLLFGSPYGYLMGSKYGGAHEPIERDVELTAIHDYDGKDRNIVMPVVRDMMAEVSRIFGLSQGIPGLWDQNGKLRYVEGLEGQR